MRKLFTLLIFTLIASVCSADFNFSTVSKTDGRAMRDLDFATSRRLRIQAGGNFTWAGGTFTGGSLFLDAIGASTVGKSFLTTANPNAIRFPRINADNTVTWRTAAEFLSDIGAGGGTDANAIHGNASGEINALTAKATPIAADLLIIEDSAAANGKKKVTLDTLPVPAAVTTALALKLSTATAASTYQPLLGTLTSWGAISRASGFDAFVATPSSALLRTLVSDESGNGVLLFANGNIGAATGASFNGNFFTAGTYTLTGSAGKTLNFTNTITLTGTDGTTMTFPATSATIYGSTTKLDVLQAAEFAADAGANDTYVVTYSPAVTAWVTGARYRFKAATANTGAATLNPNGIGAKTIVKVAGGITTALSDNDIQAGQWVEVVYDGTNLQMASQLGNAGGNTLTAGTLAGATNLTGTINYSSPDTITITTNAGAVDVTKAYGSATNSAATTLTFSTDNVTATRVITRQLINGDASNARAFTFDTVSDFTVTVPASSSVTVSMKSQGASGWALIGGAANMGDLAADTAPALTKLMETVDATTGVSKKSTVGQVLAMAPVVFTLTIDAVADSMNYTVGYVPAAFTITELRFVHNGTLSSPSIVPTIRYGTDRSVTGTAVVTSPSAVTSSTTGASVTSFSNSTPAANSWIWVTTASKSGTTDRFTVEVVGHY